MNNIFQKIDWRKEMAVISLLTAQPIYMFYVGSKTVVLNRIMTALNGAQFFSIAIILSSTIMAVTLPIAGSISDRIGRKPTYLLGLSGYCAALLISGLAVSAPMFLVGTFLCGLTNGFTCSVTLSLVADTFEEQQRPKIISYISVLNAGCSLLGPVVGGALTDYASWRLIFLVLLAMEGINLLCAVFGVPNIRPAEKKAAWTAGGVSFLQWALCHFYTC